MNAEPVILYFEKQQYNLNKLWLIYLIVGFPLLAVIVFSSYEQMYRTGSITELDDSNVVFFLINGGILIILLLIPLFISALVLTIRVFPDTLQIKLGPWLKRTVRIEELKQAEVVTIDKEALLKEYGQRKLAWELMSQNTYNVKGNQAVQLQLQDGRKIFIGSQRPAELKQVLCRLANCMVN